MTRINTNVSSLVAQNRLTKTNSELNTTLTRLSTGLRINTGKDDPAGLIASEALRSDITSINKAITNTQRAGQIIATADSALGQVSSLLNDIRGLVVEAANSGALSDDEIAANQLQVDSSLQAINRIAQTTTFQGRKLLDGSLDFNTTSGANFTKINDLRINQANLGAVGKVSLEVQVTAAATQARVNVTNIPAGGDKGTGAITLTNKVAADEAQATVASASGATFDVAVKDGSALDGAKGNNVVVDVKNGTTAATASAVTAVQTVNTTGQFSISVNANSTDFAGALGNGLSVDVVAGNTATAQAQSLAQNVNGFTGAFTISAKKDGAFDGAAGNAATISIVNGTPSAGAASAVLTGNNLVITVTDASSVSLASIKSALAGDTDFDGFDFNIAAGAQNVLFRGNGSDAIPTAFDLDGATSGTDAVAKVNVDKDAGTITITVNDNANQSLTAIKAALDADAAFAADFQFNVGNDVNFRSTGTLDDKSSVTLGNGTNAVAEASYADGVLSITVNDQTPETAADVIAALANNAAIAALFEFSAASGTYATDGSDDVSESLAGGTDDETEDVLTITGPSGQINNGAVNFIQSATVTTPTATVDEDGNLTVTVSNTAATTLSAIKTEIDKLSGYSAAVTASAGDKAFAPATDAVATTAITGATDGGISDDLVFELGGKTGSQVFEISAGTSIDDLINQVNLVTESTGVQASKQADTLILRSTAYGSKANVDLRIISEAETGTFTSAVGVRASDAGSDVVAKINGVDASGDGNRLKVKTSTLDIEISLEDGFADKINFDITGGGAKFQLGPEVVANQQARIGISSLNTARLGGVSGKLYQLAEGGSAALANNPNLAAEIVDEAINQVTSLRGRLGAFQSTTLQSNLSSLNDTVVNLQEAESSIRDADFAAESARLTRAQILVQSGTSVLGIANQNPQNVLSLLR